MQIFLVEDNLSYAIEIEMMVLEMGYQFIGKADDGETAMVKIKEKKPDLILMDIDIRGKYSGIEIAKRIKHLDIPVIFITAYQDLETYEKAKLTQPVGYLVKPFNQITLQSCIELTILGMAKHDKNSAPSENWNNDILAKDSLYIKTQKTIKKIPLQQILWLRSEGNYTYIHTENKKYVVKLSLTRMIDNLADNDFARVHKSFVVKLSAVQKIIRATNELEIQEHRVPIGRKFKAKLLNQLNTI